jgi:membrane protein YdbS with pleckstrin-like domain
MEKPAKAVQSGAKYKTSRTSYMTNYFIVILLVVFALLVWQRFSLSFSFFPQTNSELFSDLVIFIFLLVAVYLLEEADMERMLRHYFVTNNEVIKIEGIIRKKRISIPYQSVADVRVNKGVVGRLFNFGDVEITGMKENINMRGMKRPDEIYNAIQNKIARFRGGPRIRKLVPIEEEPEEEIEEE